MAAATSTGNVNQTLLDYANNRKTADKSQISEAQDRFLKLLTTQLRNQDPMNPLDNAQMTSQLAQISTVSGIEKLNATLETLLQSTADAQTTQAAGLVGHVVLVPGAGLQLAKGASAGGFELAGAADEVTVTIKDANGLTVKSLSLGDLEAGVHNFAWDGTATDGTPAADGNYTIEVSATRGEDKVPATALTFAEVRSVMRSGAGFTLDLGGLGQVAMDDVKQIL